MGVGTPEQARRKGGQKRRLMIATEGVSDTGKTEFIFSAPGPGVLQAWDRGFDAMVDNPTPPVSRRNDFGIIVINAPLNTDFGSAAGYRPFWLAGLTSTMAILSNPDVRTFAVDGDNVSWELQRLAEHGKLTGIFPQTRYTDVYAARRALYAHMWDSGKVIICTNMMRDEYRVMLDAQGNPVPDPEKPGEFKKERTGDVVAQGFSDKKHDYYWQIRIRHLFKPGEPGRPHPILKGRMFGGTPPLWGFRITKCKANPAVMGQELWGADATFTGLVQTVYPHIDPSEWGCK